jgi:hypothetical protein
MLEIEEKINKAVEYALEYVMKRSEAVNETKQ